ncbi:TlpA disulfide reductase family protein [Candidatus Igneacidithiobacillus taiwanensis]|uniref:TlpA disulfide reductase family protein n=1 Tax=Candidatus Igneacidithiobacillus taiwanensis TaxID=1945924 RepID=UPI0028A1C399|nr:TlpA disulfide reductase family protein [Candidatus Igneacidithiobacillus taiwanensis]
MLTFLQRRRFWLELLLWFLLVIAIYAFTQWRGSQGSERLQTQLPPVLLVTSLTGQREEIRPQPHEILLLNYWAPDCPPCIAETPLFVRLQHWFGGKHFGIVGLAVPGSSSAAVQARVRQLGINYPVYLASDQSTAVAGGIVLTPTTLLVNENGRIVGRYVGAIALPVILWQLFWIWV